jgi:RimJ/RimL family protein N-acetyltransferase
MYYDVDTELHQAEFGIMIGESNYWSSGYGSDAVRTMLLHIFTSTWLRRIYLHTLVTNSRAQRAFEKAGFEVDKQVRKDGFDFIRMHITRERWEELNADLLDSIDEKSQAEEAELDTQPAGRASVVEG